MNFKYTATTWMLRQEIRGTFLKKENSRRNNWKCMIFKVINDFLSER